MSLIEEQMVMYMPNSLFSELKACEDIKDTHRDLVFAYLFTIGIMWKYGYYVDNRITLADIKEGLGYSRQDKRTNYLFKVDGVLDAQMYTRASKNPPVSFKYDGGTITHTYVNDLENEMSELIIDSNLKNCIIKEPLFYENKTRKDFKGTVSLRMSTLNYFLNLDQDRKRGVSLFYLYSFLVYLYRVNDRSEFYCSNATLQDYMGWSIKKVISLTNQLQILGLIKKQQYNKSEGNVNSYIVL